LRGASDITFPGTSYCFRLFCPKKSIIERRLTGDHAFLLERFPPGWSHPGEKESRQ
jgi:hypothetical protein